MMEIDFKTIDKSIFICRKTINKIAEKTRKYVDRKY